MTLTDRERFIYHASVLMTVEILRNEIQGKRVDINGILETMLKNRCRKLKTADVKGIYEEIEEEVLSSTNVYEMYAEEHGGKVDTTKFEFKLRKGEDHE